MFEEFGKSFVLGIGQGVGFGLVIGVSAGVIFALAAAIGLASKKVKVPPTGIPQRR